MLGSFLRSTVGDAYVDAMYKERARMNARTSVEHYAEVEDHLKQALDDLLNELPNIKSGNHDNTQVVEEAPVISAEVSKVRVMFSDRSAEFYDSLDLASKVKIRLDDICADVLDKINGGFGTSLEQGINPNFNGRALVKLDDIVSNFIRDNDLVAEGYLLTDEFDNISSSFHAQKEEERQAAEAKEGLDELRRQSAEAAATFEGTKAKLYEASQSRDHEGVLKATDQLFEEASRLGASHIADAASHSAWTTNIFRSANQKYIRNSLDHLPPEERNDIRRDVEEKVSRCQDARDSACSFAEHNYDRRRAYKDTLRDRINLPSSNRTRLVMKNSLM